MRLKQALLEDWMRAYYFSTIYDIGSSGIKNFSLYELFNIIGLSVDVLSGVVFNDSETFGNIELRKELANRFGDGNDNSVLIGNGSNEVIFFLLNSVLDFGDEVIILSPIYHTLGKLAKTLCLNVKEWILDPNHDFTANIEELRSLISPQTKMIIVNFPHNPTGISITKTQYQELIKIVAQNNAYLCWDAAFEDLTFGSEPLPNPYLFYKKTIYFGTVSKSYGLAGLRLGWCIADPKVINSCKLIKDYTSLYVSPLIEQIGIYVIKNIDKINIVVRNFVEKNFQILESWLKENKNIVRGNLPQGGVCGFISVLGYQNTELLCRYLANEEKVLLVPGICFDHPSYVRLGIGGRTKDLEKGLSILSRVINNNIVN